MDKKYVVQVAQTVREQLIATTRMEILMSWGIGQFTPAIFKDLPGLKFRAMFLYVLTARTITRCIFGTVRGWSASVMKSVSMNWES